MSSPFSASWMIARAPLHGPEPKPQVEVVGDGSRRLPRHADGRETGVRRGGGDRLADARKVQDPGGPDRLVRHVLRPHESGGRPRPAIGEDVPVLPVVNEVDPRRGGDVAGDPAGGDALPLPQRHQSVAEGVRSDAGDDGGRGAQPGGGDGGVRGVPAEALEPAPVRLLVELRQRLAEGDDVDHRADLAASANRLASAATSATVLPGL